MRILDLYCGAGMAADGYSKAGFEILGVDLQEQPYYPYPFIKADALEFLAAHWQQFDAVHASPPCQAHTRAKHLRDAQGGKSKYPDLLTPTLALLKQIDKPWVVENVPGAPHMQDAVIECGSAYALGVRRHRLFLSNVPLIGSGCQHKQQGRPWGVYHVMNDNVPQGGRTARNIDHALEVMGVQRYIPWNSLKEGFPPHYTQHVGGQLMEAINGHS